MVSQPNAVIEAARSLTEHSVPVMLCLPNAKRPIPSPQGSWWVQDDPWAVEEWVKQAASLGHKAPNLAVLLGEEKDSPLVCLDADGPAGLAQLKALDVASTDSCWIAQTPHGGTHIFYYRPKEHVPPRLVRAGNLPLDLLVNGYALVAPSVVDGKPYRWVRGHGPQDITVAELQALPSAVVEWWKAQRSPGSARPGAPAEKEGNYFSKAWQLLNAPIPDGQRNDVLTRIAGWLRLYHPVPVVEALLQAINDAKCQPPLDPKEVCGIAQGIYRYPQPGVNGHPRAAVPRYVRQEHTNA